VKANETGIHKEIDVENSGKVSLTGGEKPSDIALKKTQKDYPSPIAPLFSSPQRKGARCT